LCFKKFGEFLIKKTILRFILNILFCCTYNFSVLIVTGANLQNVYGFAIYFYLKL